jgi:hypothetical protein
MEEILKQQYVVSEIGFSIYVGNSRLPKISETKGAIAKREGKALVVATAGYVQVIVNEGKLYPKQGVFLDRLEARVEGSGITVGTKDKEDLITFPDEDEVFVRIDIYAIGASERGKIINLLINIYDYIDVTKTPNLLLKSSIPIQEQVGLKNIDADDNYLEYPSDLSDVSFVANTNYLAVLVMQDVARGFTPVDLFIYRSVDFPQELKKTHKYRGETTLSMGDKGIAIWGDDFQELSTYKPPLDLLVFGEAKVRVYTNHKSYDSVDSVLFVLMNY